MYELKRNY